ncbi:hypothetical protein Clacol_010385 [Clathrus columnatus]|uniref:Probable threonine--tRNA ligase, cytoplasmic n=1 Tax=Clathrus columnatus TaxID=1419009 RepID=A0AAV5ATK7_9AGAM|nr:hypothetical protein Clacol_010385 [Clathrus columnatus]
MASTSAQHPVHSTAIPSTPAAAVILDGSGGDSKKKSKKDKGGGEGSLELPSPPDYFDHRIKIFEKVKAEYENFVKNQPRQEAQVTMPDGSIRKAMTWETSPMDIAKEISKGLAERAVIAKVDGQLWDLERPLEGSCKLEILDFENDEGKRVFWHSSAHILGEAAERRFGCHLCIGPPTDEGFYYEMGMGMTDRNILESDIKPLDELSKVVIKEKQKFERLVLPKETLLEMFQYNKYKVHLIQNKIPDGTSTTVYRCGPMVDLCVGPHVPHTGRIKAMSVLKQQRQTSASYFLGDQNNDSLQRIYGISFPDTKQLTEYKTFLEEAAKRDHRKIGKSEYRKRDYQEVISPNLFNSKLWETSGHWQNYKDDMFVLDVDKEKFGLKPMNCPGHCLIFDSRDRSYKELPIRMAEFGVLHRNEASGALTGLTRVRRFVQDDTHIFCTPQQIGDEIDGLFDFLQSIYGIFGFEFQLMLSTRPEKYLGDIETWDNAEKQLSEALEKFQPGKWSLNEGDGAFYGPKIDIKIKDALRRSFQCATIQLDFQLPIRFNLKYRSAEDHDVTAADRPPSRPVMIHRAILGSLERFIGIITEHFGGKWCKYASEIVSRLTNLGLWADVDNGENTLPKKIRNGEIAQYNFIFGQDELDSRSVNVRNRDDIGTKARSEVVPLDTIEKQLVALKESRTLKNKPV